MASDHLEELKRVAAKEAVALVNTGMILGLGTGSTVAHFLDLLAERLGSGDLADIRGVPTSERTATACRRLGIPLTELARDPVLDLAVDGADEVDPLLDLVKGLGGALVREKIVAQAAHVFVVIADETKIVDRLGTRAPLPVEVVPFAWECHVGFLEGLGARPVLRTVADDQPFVTDNGNYILDAHFADGIAEAKQMDETLAARAGIVDSGLFIGMAQEVFVAAAGGVRVLGREVAS